MEEVITFNKTYHERLLEFTDVLSGYEVLSVSNIKKEWAYYLEVSVDPVGWQAIWKIPRLTCEELGIPFPTYVLVYVQNVDFEQLQASVKVLAVQDECVQIPEAHCVPLIQLWPTKRQDESVGLNMDSTANSLDMLRFFYIYLFMPWDLEEDSTSDWLDKNLESRLHLYYDMRNGTIPVPMVEQLNTLMNEAHRLHARRERISITKSDTVTENHEECVAKFLDMQIRLIQIRRDFEILEDPVLRKVLLKRQEKLQPTQSNDEHRYLTVFKSGKVNEYVEFLEVVKKYVNEDDIQIISTLSSALDNANINDTILLSSSRHVFESLGALTKGGQIKGLYSKEVTTITSINDNITLDCNGDIILENLTIDACTSQLGIVVRSGTVTLKNCKIIGDGESSTHQGIIVFSGSRLNLIDCEVSQFYTAIVGNSGSVIAIQNSQISNASIGLKIYDKSNVKAENSAFHHCRDYGICVETDNSAENNIYQAGGFAVLEIMPDVLIKDVTGESNGKGDVVINTKAKLQPFQDVFSTPQLNQSEYREESSSDEEMEVNVTSDSIHEHNDTVIENTKSDVSAEI